MVARITPGMTPAMKSCATEAESTRLPSGSIATLPPVFKKGGTVTAGNSSGITDGAAALLVLSATAADRLRVEPMARIEAYRVVGVPPEIMGIGPVPAVRALQESTRTPLDAIDLVELNEAFAAQVLACDRELRFDRERLNVNGGAIALGHPIGCTGARIVVTHSCSTGESGSPRSACTRRRCSAFSWIGVSGFLISWATWRAISAQASRRLVRSSSAR